MKAKKQLANEIINSLKNEADKWTFGKYTADNNEWGVEVWIANVPILHTSLYQPTPVYFSLLDRIRIYRALSECRSLKIIKMKSTPKSQLKKQTI